MRRSSLDEEKEPYFIDGRNRAARFDYEGAIQSFERAVQVNPSNATAHLELGVLYESSKRDFVSALYHYHRHLQLRTNSSMANVVQEKVKGCTVELSKTVQMAGLTRDVQRDLERYAQTNAIYKRRIEALEADLTRRPQYITNFVTNFVGLPQVDGLRSSRMTQPTRPLPAETEEERAEVRPDARRSAAVGTRAAQKVASPVTRRETPVRTPTAELPSTVARATTTHQVRPGETLASLAARYGVSVQTLRAANPGSANGVRSGQRLIIPK